MTRSQARRHAADRARLANAIAYLNALRDSGHRGGLTYERERRRERWEEIADALGGADA